MKDVNITIGRFQPFTKGHLSCIESVYNELGLPTVICMIDVKDEKVDEKHPFPSSMLLPMYQDVFAKNKMIADIVLIKSANIVEIENLSDIEIKAGYSDPGYIALYALHVYGEGEKSNIYTTKDGFVFYSDDEKCLLINYIGDEKDVVLPSSFNGRAYDIHNYAFAYSYVESVTIPACVKAIGYRCFYNASELKKVIFEDTEGWTRSYDFDKGSIEYISADVMSNSTEVVKCVTNSAAEYYWRKI